MLRKFIYFLSSFLKLCFTFSLGCSLPAKIVLLDLTTKATLAYFQRNDRKCTLDAFTFNPLSAELVASFTREDEEGTVRSEILVLASMNRIVDNLSAHSGSVSFILWNPTGTHIGKNKTTKNPI